MAVLTVKGMGVYAHYRSNFRPDGSAYDCSSDGVTDNSYRNLAADGGIFLTFRQFMISLGVTSDFSGHNDLLLGAGVSF